MQKNSFFHGEVSLERVKIPTSLIKEAVRTNQLSQTLATKLSTVPDIQQFKMDTGLTLYVCNLVEALFKRQHTMLGFPKKNMIDKKDVVANTLRILCQLDEIEVEHVKNQIDTLCETKAIRSPSVLGIIFDQLAGFFLRRFF